MKGENWKNSQLALTNDLNWMQKSKEQAITERQLDMTSSGIVYGSQPESDPIPFHVTPGNNTNTLSVRLGLAYGPTGERIIIDSLSEYDSGNLSLTPPQSSGCLNIPISPISPNTTYSVWIRHYDIADPNVFSIAEDGSTKIYTRGLDGYSIVAVAGEVNPNDEQYVHVAKIVTDGSAAIVQDGITFSDRAYSTVRDHRVSINIQSATERPATYATGETTYLDNHIQAVGSGTISPINPHGLAPEDLGLTVIEGVNHQNKLHTTGIHTTNRYGVDGAQSSSALYMSVNPVINLNTDTVIIRKLSSTYGESVIVNGITVAPADIPNDVTFSFDATPTAVGWYLFVLDVSNNTKEIKKLGPYADIDAQVNSLGWPQTPAPNNQFLIGAVEWTNPSGSDYNLITDSARDYRIFGNSAAANIREELVGALESGGALGTRAKYYYRARIVGDVGDLNSERVYPGLGGTTFEVYYDDLATSVSFVFAQYIGSDDIPLDEAVRQINNAGFIGSIQKFKAEITHINNVPRIKLLSGKLLKIGGGSSNSILGFTSFTEDDGEVREVQVFGDVPYVQRRYYYPSGSLMRQVTKMNNMFLRQDYIYDADTDLLTSITESMSTWINEEATPLIASGGAIYDVGIYRLHVFTNAAAIENFTVSGGIITADMLVVGGGGGAAGGGGGGGAGGIVFKTGIALTGLVPITIGAGGSGGTQTWGSATAGTTGSDTVVDVQDYGVIYRAKGGGAGGAGNVHVATNGGSGGGAGGGVFTNGAYQEGNGSPGSATQPSQPAPSNGFGNNGGGSYWAPPGSGFYPGGASGGGGGAAAPGGGAYYPLVNGNGGAGIYYNLSGTGTWLYDTYYSAGGGGKNSAGFDISMSHGGGDPVVGSGFGWDYSDVNNGDVGSYPSTNVYHGGGGNARRTGTGTFWKGGGGGKGIVVIRYIR